MVQFFEPINFGLGAASGVLTTLAVQRIYRYARSINENRERSLVRTFASREADEGYLLALVDFARKSHLLGHKIRLDEILVQPRFIPPRDMLHIPAEGEPIENVFASLPQVHDYPHLHAPYNIPSLSIADLSRGVNRIVMVGQQGSGRTTALLTIALWSSGYLEIEEEHDQIMTDLEAELDPKRDVSLSEQVLRIRRRIAAGKASHDRMISDDADDKPRDPTEPNDEVRIEAASRFRSLAPLYVHLADIVLDSGEYGRDVDPSEPLVRALQRQAGWLSSKRMVNKTYQLLENGFGLVLIDGYDDILAEKQPDALRWIRALMELYPDNFYIVTMPPEGYGLLMESGAVPVYLQPWNTQDVAYNMNKVQKGWGKISKTSIEFPRSDFESVEAYANALKDGGRQHLALENTLRTFSIFAGMDEDDTNYSEQMQAYIESLYPKASDIMPALQRLATIQLDNAYITLDTLIDYALQKEKEGHDPQLARTTSMQAARTATDDAPDYGEFFQDSIPETTTAAQDTSIEKDANSDSATGDEKLRKKISNEQSKLLDRLLSAGLLLPYRGGRYQFRHKIIASYLAARDLVNASEDIVYRKFLKADWAYAMNYLAEMRDMDFLVAEQLDNPLDVRLDNVLKLTNWLKFAGQEATWRNNLLRYLGNLFASAHQYTVIRERVAAALVGSKDEGARIVFRRALQTTNPDVRRIACLALGAMRDDGAIDALSQVVLQDSSLENKIAGEMSLIAIGTEEALFAAIDLMDVEGIEEIRRAVTESLAADSDIGFPTIRDMLESESISMRRAALYGLGRVEQDWSWILIDRIFQDDTESFVRLASEVVMRQKFDRYFYQLNSYPDMMDAPWFINWEDEQRELGFIAFDMEANEITEFAFTQNQNPIIRKLMTDTYGRTGQYDMLERVYTALEDPDNSIRDAAYRTLAEFQGRLGTPIPAPVE